MFKCAGYAQWNVAISLHIHVRIQCSCDDVQRNNGAIILADTIADCELATNADSFCCVCDTGSSRHRGNETASCRIMSHNACPLHCAITSVARSRCLELRGSRRHRSRGNCSERQVKWWLRILATQVWLPSPFEWRLSGEIALA